MQHYVFALAGNQNSGKTTLFNRLTGSNQHVGNWPGVTVEQKTGTLIHHHHGDSTHFGPPLFRRRENAAENTDVQIVDLPGIYSLSPYTMEEVVSRDFITLQKPDAVINIVDATNLERNLYLTLQLAELETPMVVALNMMDEVNKNGDTMYVDKLSQALGVAVVPICARKGEGMDELVRQAMLAAEKKLLPRKLDICQGETHEALHAIIHLIEENARAKGLSPRYAGTKLLEGDERMEKLLALDENTLHIIGEIIARLEKQEGMERAAIMADARYTFLDGIMRACVVKSKEAPESKSARIDKIVMHRALAFPILILMMLLVFFITFGPIGSAIADGFAALINQGVALIDQGLAQARTAPWVHDLLVNGVLAGVGSVLGFLPTIVILFLLLSILEDSGYMARAAFLIDKPMRKLGLNGRSFIPMVMGFGCTVPAVMGARSMQSQRDRRFTIMLTPFMSCGAKVPIYALFTRAFFPEQGVLVMCCLYLGGMLMAVLSALVLKKTVFHGDAAPFIMELPSYRLPTPGNVWRTLWDKAKDFLQRAFTIILAATVVVWFLQSYTFSLTQAVNLEESMMGVIGSFLAPLFRPLGFGSVAPATAVLTGVIAKESVVSTLSVLSGVDPTSDAMLAALHGIFPSTLSAVSFLTFVLLYMPCVAAYAAMRREMEGKHVALASVAAQTALAWVTALAVYQVGSLFIF